MRVVVLSHLDPVTYPALRQIAVALHEKGAEVTLVSPAPYDIVREHIGDVKYRSLRRTEGVRSRLIWYRTRFDNVLSILKEARPDVLIAQNDYISPAMIYKISAGNKCNLVTHLTEYQRNRRYIKLLRYFSGYIDTYIDVCDVWLRWRKADWRKLDSDYFIIRQTPNLQPACINEQRTGVPRIVFTGSKYVLRLNRERLVSFLAQICDRGISIDWYLPGAEETRSIAREMLSHPLYSVKGPVPKLQLLETLRGYDAGLHWAPMIEKNYDPDYFISAASNKIGEYVAAGLVVAHAGNPGLAFLPENACAIYDATDPIRGADQLASLLSDRSDVDRRREEARRFHRETFNFEAQAAPFVNHILQLDKSRANLHEAAP